MADCEQQKLAPKEAFEAVDADKDGMITKEETQQLVKQLELKLEDSDIEKLFAPQQEEGENKDKISFEDFATVLQAEA